MTPITLRYSSTKLTSLTYDSGASYQSAFVTVKCSDPLKNVTADNTVLLNGRKVNNKKWVHKEIDVIISADEIDSTAFAFLQSFWSSNYKYISLNGGTSWGNYIRVLTGDGLFPLKYIDDLKDLPEAAFKFSYVLPE